MKDISHILSSIGLHNSEILTYLAALNRGPSTVITLVKDTDLSRQATYVAIEGLTKRGLMSSVQRGKKRYFASEPPAKLLAYAERHANEMAEKVKELAHAVPQMELSMGGEKPIVRVFEGKEGLREILDDIKSTKSRDVYEITDVAAMTQVLTAEDLTPMRQELLKNGVVVHGLYTRPSTEKNIRTNHFVLKPEESNFRTNIGIYGNKLALVTFEGKMQSVIIESPAIVKTMKIIFTRAMQTKKW